MDKEIRVLAGFPTRAGRGQPRGGRKRSCFRKQVSGELRGGYGPPSMGKRSGEVNVRVFKKTKRARFCVGFWQ